MPIGCETSMLTPLCLKEYPDDFQCEVNLGTKASTAIYTDKDLVCYVIS